MLLTISLSTTSNSLLKESKRDKKSKIGLSVCSYVPSTCFSRNQLVARKVRLICRSVGLFICPSAIVSLQHILKESKRDKKIKIGLSVVHLSVRSCVPSTWFSGKGRLTLSACVSVSPSVHLSICLPLLYLLRKQSGTREWDRSSCFCIYPRLLLCLLLRPSL